MNDTGKWVALKKGKGITCPVCGNDHACKISGDGAAVLCRRISEGSIRPLRDGMGGLHILKGGKRVNVSKETLAKAMKPAKKLTRPQLELIIKQHRSALSPDRLTRAAESLGLSTDSLNAFGIGFDPDTGAYSFPMYDGERRPIGIRTRYHDGTKGAIKGSSNGLFIPSDLEFSAPKDGATHQCLLLVPEGPTDAAAARDLGFRAIGRPSNSGGRVDLRRLLVRAGRNARQAVVMIADKDQVKYDQRSGECIGWPGWEGALTIAASIIDVCASLRVMKPPSGKDLREWKNGGGMTAELTIAINAAPCVDEQWLNEEILRIAHWKPRLRRKAI